MFSRCFRCSDSLWTKVIKQGHCQPNYHYSYGTHVNRIVPAAVSKYPSIRQDEKVLHDLYGAADQLELSNLAKNLSPAYNFAAYINNSLTLQKLVQLGVDLSKIQKKREVAEYVLQLDFEKDIEPYVKFLCDHGIEPDKLGDILSKNILICKESLDDLEVRVNYLVSKDFTSEMVTAIITRNPLWLSTPASVIDARLGWLQKTYKLSGDDVRTVVNALPQIATFSINTIKLNNFVFEEEMGMTKNYIKNMLLNKPRLFVKNQRKLLAAFEYVYKIMKVPTDIICQQPEILMASSQTIKERHLFLKSLGRAQYNPYLPGFISLDAFIKCDDTQFAAEVAKSSIISFNLFLKTL